MRSNIHVYLVSWHDFLALDNYGDICHFYGNLNSGGAFYISSYPNFPQDMSSDANFQCSCLLTSKPTSLSFANVTIRALLVKLTGSLTICSERLSIADSNGDNILDFCSPRTSVNDVTTVSLSSDAAISFRRDPIVSPFNGKFILEMIGQKLLASYFTFIVLPLESNICPKFYMYLSTKLKTIMFC